ncbi:MAG: trimethylamine methyltransferase family protein, partial [Myxococcota bacterium]|nr:trimethylamine methyltransferase family protein [Myxococcota bacterium]
MSEQKPTSKPTASRRSRRSGGRDARRAARAADEGGHAVRPGMSGGAYKPLDDRDIERIHDAALHVLETIGVGDPIPEILDVVLPKGCLLGDDGRVRFPRALVEEAIANAPKAYVLHAPDPRLDMEVKEKQVILTTSGEPVKILDYE